MSRGDDRLTPSGLCTVYGCENERVSGSYYCSQHKPKGNNTPERVESVYDHIKINIERSSKGARVTVTYDRSDHDMEVAIQDAVQIYGSTIKALKDEGLQVDES